MTRKHDAAALALLVAVALMAPAAGPADPHYGGSKTPGAAR